MSARLPLLVVLAGLLALPSAASAATKNGVTPLSPKAGSSIPVGKRPVMKMRIKGSGQVYVHVCKSKKKDSNGVICYDESIGRAKKKGGIVQLQAEVLRLPRVLAQLTRHVLLAGPPHRL